MNPITNFPHLTPSEFSSAISSFQTLYRDCTLPQANPWHSVDSFAGAHGGTRWLRITKVLSCTRTCPGGGGGGGSTQGKQHRSENVASSSSSSCKDDDDDDDEEVEDDQDDEVVLDVGARPHPLLRYDILLSPTYAVPVLYFDVKDAAHRFPPTMRVLYESVVPEGYAAQTRDGVGVLGGVTVSDHPVTNAPVWFIHPCKTAEVLEASRASFARSTRGRENAMDPLSYLVLWMGAMGRYVGLDVPLEVGVAVMKGREGEKGNGAR